MSLDQTLFEFDYRDEHAPRLTDKVTGTLHVTGYFQGKEVTGRLKNIVNGDYPCHWAGAKLAKHGKILGELTHITRFSNGTLELAGRHGWLRYKIF